MSDVATPEGEARLGPDGPPQSQEDQAAAAISGFLNPQREGVENTPEEPEPEPAPEEPIKAEEAEEAPEPEEAPEEQASEDSDEFTSVEELPSDLSGFAEAIGVTPEELAGHLQVPVGKNEDGSVQSVTLAEAIRGNLRESDYTRKTTELADARKEFDAGVQAAKETLQQNFQKVDDLTTELEALVQSDQSEEHLNQLLEEDPQEYLRVRAQKDARERALGEAQQLRLHSEEQNKQAYGQQQQAFRREQQAQLLVHIPDLGDETKRPVVEKLISSGMTGSGFSADEIKQYMNGPYDARMIRMAEKAAKYDALEAGKKAVTKKVKSLPRVIKPGAATTQKKGDAVVASRQRMIRSGSDADATSWIKGLL